MISKRKDAGGTSISYFRWKQFVKSSSRQIAPQSSISLDYSGMQLWTCLGILSMRYLKGNSKAQCARVGAEQARDTAEAKQSKEVVKVPLCDYYAVGRRGALGRLADNVDEGLVQGSLNY